MHELCIVFSVVFFVRMWTAMYAESKIKYSLVFYAHTNICFCYTFVLYSTWSWHLYWSAWTVRDESVSGTRLRPGTVSTNTSAGGETVTRWSPPHSCLCPECPGGGILYIDIPLTAFCFWLRYDYFVYLIMSLRVIVIVREFADMLFYS